MPPPMRPGPPPMGGGPHEKEKTDFKSLGKLAGYCKEYIVFILIAFACAICGAMANIIGPEKVSDMVNLITGGMFTGIDMQAIFVTGATLAGIYVLGAAMSYIQQFIMATVTQSVSKRLRTDIDKKINLLPLKYFDRSTKGDLLSRITNDVDIITQTLSMSIANLVSSLAIFIGVIYKMFYTNYILAIVTIATSFLGFAFMAFIMGKSQKYFNRKQEYLGEMNGQIEEIYTNHAMVSAYGAKEQEKRTFSATNEKLFESNWKSQWLAGMMMPVMTFVGNLAYVLIFVIGIAFIVNGNGAVTLGTIMAFVIYAKLFSQPLSTFAQSMTSIQQASAASRRIFGLLGEEELSCESEKCAKLERVLGNVKFESVKFGYSPEKRIIKNFSADFKAGQKVAIVGHTGAGKTTIVNLLMRFYETDEGSISVDGVPISKMSRESVHDLFDMILQDTWLFEGSIRENLIYNKKDVSEEALDVACKAVGLKAFIDTLPQGYGTIVNEALNLSEGQKQQMTIARAIIRDAPLLILDEATSSVDTRTEIVIQQAMDRLTKGRTSFVIAHRLSTIRNADIILLMRDGDIIEQGTHDELLMRGGSYAELYNSQFAV